MLAGWRTVVAGFVAVATAACSPTQVDHLEGVSFLPVRAAVSLGDTVHLAISNGRRNAVYFGDCNAQWWQRRLEDGWTPPRRLRPEITACAAVLVGVGPRQSFPFWWVPTPDLGPGTYRLVVEMVPEGETPTVLLSDSFLLESS